MKTIPLDMLYSSDLERAVQTAEAINKYQKTPLQIHKDIRLRERKMGKYEGTFSSDVKKIAADLNIKYADYCNSDNEFECEEAMVARFTEWFTESVISSVAEHVGITSHGAFIRSLV